MRRLARLQRVVDGWHTLQQRALDAVELAALEDDEIRSDLEKELAELQDEVNRR